MAKRTPEQEAERRRRRASTFANQDGYKSYQEGEDWKNHCSHISSELKQSFKYGWERGEREHKEYDAAPKCPICNDLLIEKLSGNFCINKDSCGYHTHNKESIW